MKKTTVATRLPVEGELPSFGGATGWLNSTPLTAASLRGKVVVVEFWTYSCINWRRTLPYVRAWAERYKDRGLVVIGVHTPEFAFEHDAGNVRWAVREMGIDFPVALDGSYAIWNAFDNNYWPALYFVDARGRIRHHHFGEGDYAESERVIGQLLAEAGFAESHAASLAVEPRGFEAAADWAHLDSSETYAGYGRTENFASPGGMVRNVAHDYSLPEKLERDHWALRGTWTANEEYVASNRAGGNVAFRFRARDFHLVMGRAHGAGPTRFRVLIDGRPPGSAHGIDVDEQGYGTVSEPRLYQLVRQHAPIDDRTVEVEFGESGVEVFDFTFG